MPSFSNRSNARLDTCHEDLQELFREVVKYFDCTIIEGHRSSMRQADLYAQGRTRPGKIVTHKDGVTNKSKHQTSPSIAVDVVPYFAKQPHIRWDDANRFHEMAGFVQAFALGMNIKTKWGGHWRRFVDLPHWQIEVDEDENENPNSP